MKMAVDQILIGGLAEERELIHWTEIADRYEHNHRRRLR